MRKRPQPNFDMAKSFLDIFDPDCGCWTFQTFDDNADRARENKTNYGIDPLAKVLHGTLTENWEQLVDLNQRGAGVFFTVQLTDCRGRKSSNIIAIRALFQEDDGEGNPLPFEPHFVVESSPGKYHRYIMVKDLPLGMFKPLQEVLVNEYGSDPNAKDIARVLRLPGFNHQKVNSKKGLVGNPHLVRVVK